MLSIEIRDLSFSYNQEKKIISNLSANLNEGDKVIIKGKNGSGKSTLLQIISGLIKSKSISYNGFSKFSSPLCSYLSHNLNLYKDLNSFEHFEFFSKLIFKNLEKKDEFLSLVEKFNLNDKLKLPVYSLSKGEKGKLSLILKLFYKPKILLLDEPETALDKESRGVLLLELENLSKFYQGKNIVVIVSHTDLFEGFSNKNLNL